MAKKQIELPKVQIFRKDTKPMHGGYKGRFHIIKDTADMPKHLVGNDIQYKCQKCGECCRRGFSIELSLDEMKKLSKKHPGIKTVYEIKTDNAIQPFFNTGPACSMLEGDLCAIYRDRPFECKFYPFHLEEVDKGTKGAIEFGRKYYHLYAYDDCIGLGEGEMWSQRKTQNFLNRLLRGHINHRSMLKLTYKKLTTEEFFENHLRYGTGVIYGTERQLEDFLVDYKSKIKDEE